MNQTFNDFGHIQNYCRICLEKKDNLLPMHSKVRFDYRGDLIESEIETVLLNLNTQKINDGFDNQMGVCNNCLNLVQATFELKIILDVSTSILKNGNFSFETKKVSETNNNKNVIEHDHNYKACNSTDEGNEDSDNIGYNVDENKAEVHLPPENTEIFILNDFPKHKSSTLQDNIEKSNGELKKTQPVNLYQAKFAPKSKILHNCPICSMELSALALRKHIQTHKCLKGYLKVPKSHENVIFYTSPKRMIPLINRKEKNIYKCIYCTEQLSLEDFCTHVEVHNTETEHKCGKCDRVFRKLSHLNIHQHYHKKDFAHICEICNKGFISKQNYDCHLITHTATELPHPCDYCDKKFANPLHLQRHLVVHTENRSYHQKYKVWKCRICARSFKSNEDMTQHSCTGPPKPLKMSQRNVKYRNNTAKRHACKMCPKNFGTAGSLYCHVQIKHQGKDPKSLCSMCGKHVRNMTHHMKRHLGVTDYKCHLCPKGFLVRTSLQQHLLVHSGKKPFICSSCGKTFNNLYNLQVHERIHVGVKSHLCTICGKAFLEKSYLKKHMNVHKELKDEKKYYLSPHKV